jgi:hypothetical protein
MKLIHTRRIDNLINNLHPHVASTKNSELKIAIRSSASPLQHHWLDWEYQLPNGDAAETILRLHYCTTCGVLLATFTGWF